MWPLLDHIAARVGGVAPKSSILERPVEEAVPPGGSDHGEASLGERDPSEPVGLPHAVLEGPDSRLSCADSVLTSREEVVTR